MSAQVNEYYWNLALDISAKAIAKSKLQPIKTNLKYISCNQYINFECRSINSSFKFSKVYGPKKNPFCPWDKGLELELIGNDHVLILNKYPVQIGHMLLITKGWRPQDGWLSFEDWKAIKVVDNDTKGLWFFNSCSRAGASQRHRHIQLLRREHINDICPLQNYYKNLDVTYINSSEILSKNITVVKRDKDNDEALDLFNSYHELSVKSGIGNPNKKQKPLYPYNLLISPEWIALIKRSSEFTHGFSLNALAFAGYLLSTDNQGQKWLEQNGPIKLLENVVMK